MKNRCADAFKLLEHAAVFELPVLKQVWAHIFPLR